MNDNVTSFAAKKYFKDSGQLLGRYISELKELSDNPRLAQGLVVVLTAAITGIDAFHEYGKHWIPALRSTIKTGPEDHLEALVISFYSDVAIKDDGGKLFMTLSIDLDPKWVASIEETLKDTAPVVPDEIIPAVNQFSHLNGEEIINNFAFIEFAVAATLRDFGFSQHVFVSEADKVVVCTSRKGGVMVVQTVHHQVHHDDHLFLKNYFL